MMHMDRKICVVGLGYVGLPLLIKFGKKGRVYGYDTDEKRIEELKNSHDRTGEVEKKDFQETDITFSSDPAVIKESDFIIVAIPTPISRNKKPDLNMLKDATKTIGKNLKGGSIVIFESTVYPGVTEEICIPILEKSSGLKFMKDFKVGYSPERINPGDREHTVERIVKVVSGCDKDSTEIIADVYSSIVKAGVYKAPSIKVAEAAKAIENTQRDINIALMNELKMIFDKMGIDINEVLKAARTKWNFFDFHPGLVGGHCIGVDPYYLAYKAEAVGHHPEIILAGRKINDNMANYMVSIIIKDMSKKDIIARGGKVLVLGATFKPNVRDIRNSKIEDIVKGLKNHGCSVDIHDPLLRDKKNIFGCANVTEEHIKKTKYEYVILAVGHSEFGKLDFKPDFII